MVDQRLVNYIKSELSRGVSLNQIKQDLLAQGWSDYDIDEAVSLATQQRTFPTPPSYQEPVKSSKLWIVPILIVVIIIGGIFAFFMFGRSELELGITVPKSTYAIGETLDGDFLMKYAGKPFEGIVLYTYSRKGFDKKYYVLIRGNITDVDFSNPEKTRGLKVALKPFKLDETGYVASTDYFYEEGEYSFAISVYDCKDVEAKLNKACRNVEPDELSAVSPLKTKSVTITVSGGETVSECKTSADCTETCEGCREGKQICEQAKEICMECFTDFQCKEGYKCEENKCVKEIVQEPQVPAEGPLMGEGKPIDCGSDLDCFITASQNCQPANITHTITINIFGVEQTTTSYYEIKGLEAGKCIFYLRTEKIDLTFPPETPQDIVDQEKEIYKKLEGRDGTCKFNTNDLTAMLNRWKVGNFSTEDWDVAECQGNLFSYEIK